MSKNTHGGKRHGAGRPPLPDSTRQVFVVTNRQVRWLEDFAKSRELGSRSAALRAILEHLEKTVTV